MTAKGRHPIPRAAKAGISPAPVAVSENELILLGLIAEGPIHAYGLEEKVHGRQMAEWTKIAPSSIYRVLRGLERKGLIDTRFEHGGQGATRKVHALTDTGREALVAGILTQLSHMEAPKSPYWVGLAYAGHAPRGAVVAKVAERAARVREMQGGVGALEQEIIHSADDGGPSPQRALAVRLLFSHIRHHMGAELVFLDEAARILAMTDAELLSVPAVAPANKPGKKK